MSRGRRRRRPAAPKGPPAAGPPVQETPKRRPPMTYVTQTGAVIAVLSGLAGFVFLLVPQLKPEPPPAKRSVTIELLSFAPGVSFREYLLRTNLPTGLYTPRKLAERVALVQFRYQSVGYRGEALPIRSELFDADSRDQVHELEAISLAIDVNDESGVWHAYAPLPARRGRYFLLVQLMDPRGAVPLDRLETETFRVAAPTGRS